MIKVLSGKIEELDMKETLRYLGYAGVKSADGIEGSDESIDLYFDGVRAVKSYL